MRKVSLILTFVLTTFLCFGQKQHLEPSKDFSQYKGVLKTYFDNVFKLLYTGYSEKPIARYTSMPSFSNEYSFSIETIKGKNYVVSNKLSTNYWYANNKNEVELFTNKLELSNALFLKIVELFGILDEQTKKPEENSMGCDGVTYYFATTNKDGQVKIAETWSPDKNSLLGNLVKICDNIFAFGIGKEVSQTETLKDINKLIENFKQ